jgi:hypothetical protein
MRPFLIITPSLLAVVLSGCAAADPHSVVGIMTETAAPGTRAAYEAEQDDKKCRSFGYSPEASNQQGSNQYANVGCSSSKSAEALLRQS